MAGLTPMNPHPKELRPLRTVMNLVGPRGQGGVAQKEARLPLHAVSMAAISRQSRKFLPLLPEFREVIYMPASFRPDKSCKILLSHESAGGEKGASKPLQTSEVRSRSPIRGKPQQSGEWHSEPATVADETTARLGRSGEAYQSSSSPVRRKPQQSSERARGIPNLQPMLMKPLALGPLLDPQVPPLALGPLLDPQVPPLPLGDVPGMLTR